MVDLAFALLKLDHGNVGAQATDNAKKQGDQEEHGRPNGSQQEE